MDCAAILQVQVFKVRQASPECKFSNDDISDDELAELFRAIDADGSGALSSQEFFAAMKDYSDDLSLNFYCFKKSIFELADLYVDSVSENMYVAFLDTVHEEIAEEIEESIGMWRVQTAIKELPEIGQKEYSVAIGFNNC